MNTKVIKSILEILEKYQGMIYREEIFKYLWFKRGGTIERGKCYLKGQMPFTQIGETLKRLSKYIASGGEKKQQEERSTLWQ